MSVFFFRVCQNVFPKSSKTNFWELFLQKSRLWSKKDNLSISPKNYQQKSDEHSRKQNSKKFV